MTMKNALTMAILSQKLSQKDAMIQRMGEALKEIQDRYDEGDTLCESEYIECIKGCLRDIEEMEKNG